MMTCTVCSEHLDTCRFPLSHGHATIHNIKLPAKLNGVLAKNTYPRNLSLQDRRIIESTKVHDNDFSTEVEALPCN